MKIVISALAIVVLMTVAPSAFAQAGAPLSKHPQADYQSGYEHGVSDAKCVYKKRMLL
jgi:hypothetical protein